MEEQNPGSVHGESNELGVVFSRFTPSAVAQGEKALSTRKDHHTMENIRIS
jgi:hypothetical protein